MIKKYDLVYLNGEMYMIKNVLQRDLVLEDIVYTEESDYGKQIQLYRKSRSSSTILGKVVATTDKSLGLPLLPAIEEGIHRDAYSSYDKFMQKEKDNYTLSRDESAIHSDGFVWGYTEAVEAKRFTEEDIRKAFKAGHFAAEEGSDKVDSWLNYQQSLTPKPIAVEVEMEDNQCDGCQAGLPLQNGTHKDHQVIGIGCTANRYNQLKLDDKKRIKVKRWIYEE